MPLILLIMAIWLMLPAPVEAKKKLPSRKITVTANLPQTALKLRADRQALLLVLTNLSRAGSVAYRLTYQADGVSQGAEGSYDPAAGNTQKELVFGTCSGNVCTYHQNISDMLFQATIGLTDGRTLSRKYQINI